MNLKLACVIAAAAAAAACASKPPVETTAPPPVQQQPVAQPQAPAQPAYTGPAPGTIQHFVETAGDRVFFDYDQSSIRADAASILEKQAQWLAAYPGASILVAGNCDERGTREYNLALGARRANAVKDFLVARGVEASRISTVSYGKERPIADGSDDRSWALNRNGHTTIVAGAIG